MILFILEFFFLFLLCLPLIKEIMSTLTKLTFPRARIEPDQMKSHIVAQGGSRVTQQIFPSNSWGSANQPLVQASWSISPPSTQTILDRNVRIKCYLKVETNVAMQLGTNDALRQFPIQAITDVITCQINGETISQNTADIYNAMLCFENDAVDRLGDVSTSPAMPDQYQQYADWQTYGSARNPLADYGENSAEMSRGGFPVVLAEDGKSFTCEVVEPLFLSPFLSGMGGDSEGLVNINQLNINFRWTQNTNRVLCHSTAGNAITTVTVSFYQAPEILMNYITPQIIQPLPTVQTVYYEKLQQYIKPYNAITNNTSFQVISDSIKLSMIPSAMYLFVRHSRASSNYLVSDSYCKLSNIQVLFNNQSGLLATASDQELFSIAQRCGLNLSWAQYSKYRGSVFAVRFGEDIGLQANEAAGVAGQYTLQIQATAQNISGATGDFEFFTLFSMPGTCSVYENGARTSIGNFSEAMVLSAAQGNEEVSHEIYRAIHGGRRGSGRFLDRFKSFINKVSHGISRVADFARPVVASLAPEFSPLLEGVANVSKITARHTGGKMGGSRTSGGRLSRLR